MRLHDVVRRLRYDISCFVSDRTTESVERHQSTLQRVRAIFAKGFLYLCFAGDFVFISFICVFYRLPVNQVIKILKFTVGRSCLRLAFWLFRSSVLLSEPL